MTATYPLHSDFPRSLENENVSSGRDLEITATSCEYELAIPEELIPALPKFTEGILVGGHVLVMIFSGCGNIAALIIVIKSKAPKLSTKYFLIMLALSDLLMTVIAPPTEISKLMLDFSEWIFGRVMCKTVPFLQLVSATMSAICLMAIAAERNFLIVRAMNSNTSTLNRIWQKWIVPLISVTIIILPIGCALPQLWYYRTRPFLAIPSQKTPSSTSPATENPTESTTSTTSEVVSSIPSTTVASPSPTCDVRMHCVLIDLEKSNNIYWSITGATYFLLLFFFLISYISIYRFVKKHGQFKKRLEEEDHSNTTVNVTSISTSVHFNNQKMQTKSNKFVAGERHRKTLKLILGLILLHLCCRAPNWVFLVVWYRMEIAMTETALTLQEVFHFLSTVNCALNPFLYVIWNHSLRANDPAHGGMAADKRASNVLCRKIGSILQTICCKCCKRREEYISDHLPGEPVIHPTSSGWLWKTPTIYHVANESGDSKNLTVSNQRALYSEKRAL